MRIHNRPEKWASVLSFLVFLLFVTVAVAQSSEKVPGYNLNDGDQVTVPYRANKNQEQTHGYIANELIVRFDSNVGRHIIADLNATQGVSVIEEISQLSAYRLRLPKGVKLDTMMKAYREHPGVEYAEPNYLGRGGDVYPNDTFFRIQWHLNNAGQTNGTPDADIDAVEGWQITRGNPAIIVAILDTGIRSSNPEFLGRLLLGYDFVNEDDDPEADHPHGILVSGILAANSDNAYGVAGVDHRAMLLPVKVLDSANLGTTFDLAEGLVFAADRGAHVINMSLINYPRIGKLLEDALTYARDFGSILVACAGNGGVSDADRSFPGASPLTISIGATDHNDVRAYFSGTGDALDMVAPGRNVVTVADEASFEDYELFSGCSAATPVASGIASLLLSVDSSLTHERIRQIMIQSAEDQVGPSEEDTPGRDEYFGYGRINLNDALRHSQNAIVIAIDIDPGSELNKIRPSSTKPIQVAIIGDSSFDVAYVSCASLRFGPSLTEATDCEIKDINVDGIDDYIASFTINVTGIECGDTEATLLGTTMDSSDITGKDRVTTIGCRP